MIFIYDASLYTTFSVKNPFCPVMLEFEAMARKDDMAVQRDKAT